MLIDDLYSIGRVRRTLWRHWYPLVTRALGREEVLFLNYAFDDADSAAVALDQQDEPNRSCIHLYHHVATLGELGGKDVLEISCGHGGGASYLTRTFRPHSYLALDINPAGIRFCRRRHLLPGLSFLRGDAENLAVPDASVDVVLNIEASHCYASFPKFLSEVHRVLRPGGVFLYADFRPATALGTWDASIEASPLAVLRRNNISASVLRGMTKNSPRFSQLVMRHLPRFLHRFGREFAGVQGSKIYQEFERGDLVYRSYALQKPVVNGQT